MVWNDWDARLGHGAAAHPDLPAQTGLLHAVSAPAEHHKAAVVQNYTVTTDTYQSVKSKPVNYCK